MNEPERSKQEQVTSYSRVYVLQTPGSTLRWLKKKKKLFSNGSSDTKGVIKL